MDKENNLDNLDNNLNEQGDEKITSIRPDKTTGPRRKPLGSVLRDFTSDTIKLTRKEVELARTEVGEKIDQAQSGAVSMVVGGAVLFFGVELLLASAVLSLAHYVPDWASALYIGIAVCIIGAVLLAKARSNLAVRNLKPQTTIETIRENGKMAKEAWHGERKHG
jgi:hypothetical protein